MTDALPTVSDHLRRVMFTPLKSKAALHSWIVQYLGLDMPDTIIDPESTSTPMDLIWEVYDAARDNNRPDFNRCVAYASRDSFKTLGAAVLEVLALVHLKRNVAHMAAIESQASKAVSYVEAFLQKPLLREFVSGSNKREMRITRYHNPKTGENLNKDQFADLTFVEKLNYEEISNYLKVIICTPKGANSEHVPFFVVDEVDLANPQAYEEAKMIPAPYGEQLPITLLTSTRKYAFGMVQRELDNAAESGTHSRHWNIIDVTERCPTTRHRPDLPIIDAYYNTNDLTSITQEVYNQLPADSQAKYEHDKAFSGCLSNCKLFAVCRGRLTKQKPPNPQAKVRQLLKPISVVQSLFKSVNTEVAKAQLLCWKPSTAGLIYPNFDSSIHMLTAAQMAEMLTGNEFPPEFSKAQLIALMSGREARYASGMDFGYTHRFAVVTGAIDGNRAFIFDCISIAEIELEQQIESCEGIKPLRPKISADSASPQSIKTFSKKGFRIKGVDKGKGSVLDGINIVRTLLKPGLGAPPRMYLLKDDPGCVLLAKRISQYHWLLDTKTGEPTDIPDDKDDDECDALRYFAMANFSTAGKVVAAKETAQERNPQQSLMQAPPANAWLNGAIRSNLGERVAEDPGGAVTKGRKNGFFWDMG